MFQVHVFVTLLQEIALPKYYFITQENEYLLHIYLGNVIKQMYFVT